MNNPQEGKWLLIIKTDDRPGAAASAAVAFSGRGLQIESFIGSGDVNCYSKATEGHIAITFKAFTRHMQRVTQVLTRLEQVRELVVYDYNDPTLLKTATVRTSKPLSHFSKFNESLAVSVVDLQIPDDQTHAAVISGRPSQVDTFIEHIKNQESLISMVYTILPPR